MKIHNAIVCIALFSLSGTLHAQVCTGGAGGGMDATGNECSDSGPVSPAVQLEEKGSRAAT